MLHRSESQLTLWQHHSLGILWCNTKTGLSRNNRQCYGKSYRTEPQNISVPEMHKNTVHMFLKRGMIVIQPFRWIGMQNTNLLHAGMLPGFSRAVITVFISHRFDDHSGRLSVRSPCCDNEIRQYIFLGFAPIFPDICYHLTHYKPAAADIPVASDNPAHYADAIRYNARTPLQGSLLPLTRLVWA